MELAGTNQEIPILGCITVCFSINSRRAYHEFGLVKILPIDIHIGAEFKRPHEWHIM